jgi:tetratricopeptide (TPR) repeat protein
MAMKGKKLFRGLITITLLAGLAVGGFVAGMAAYAQEAAQQQQQQKSPWKDRAEYDAFNAILQQQGKDNNKLVELADAYLAKYPDSKVLKETYELKLAAYQALNNTAKMEETANKLLEIDPGNLRAILLLSYLFPRTYNTQDPMKDQKLSTAEENARKGLAALASLQQPQGVAPDQFQKQKADSEAVLHQTLGFVALEKKDYATAEQELRQSAQSKPNDALGFYWLGRTYLSEKPPDYEKGMWAMARSVSITGPTALNAATQAQFKDYLSKAYEARHGSTDGLDDLLAQASSTPFPPDGFHIKTAEEMAPPAPEPPPEPPKRELTVKVEDLTDFSKIREHLQAGGVTEEDTWTLLKGATLPLPGKVISATPAANPTKIHIVVSPELAQQEGKYDVELTLAQPLGKKLAAGTTINFEGVLDAYTPKPFLLKMVDGKITP